jgi:hypothetical protein
MRLSKKLSASHESRAASTDDLNAWARYDAQQNRKSSSDLSSGVPVGLMGVIEEEHVELLYPKDAGAHTVHRQLTKDAVLNASADKAPIAPAFTSKRRFQVIASADLASWNRNGDSKSMPVGLLGVIPDEVVERLFDDQKDDLRKRNAEVAQLLKQQQQELAYGLEVSEFEKKQEEELAKEDAVPSADVVRRPKPLQRSDSLRLSQQISSACQLFAAESESELQETQDQIRLLRDEMRRLSIERDAVTAQMIAAEAELSARKEGSLCVVCRKTVHDRVYVPCGHLCVCGTCAETEKLCPVCMQEPTSVQPVKATIVDL